MPIPKDMQTICKLADLESQSPSTAVLMHEGHCNCSSYLCGWSHIQIASLPVAAARRDPARQRYMFPKASWSSRSYRHPLRSMSLHSASCHAWTAPLSKTRLKDLCLARRLTWFDIQHTGEQAATSYASLPTRATLRRRNGRSSP